MWIEKNTFMFCRKSFAVTRINNNSQSSTSLKNNDSTFADASGKDEMVELISQYLDNGMLPEKDVYVYLI